MLGKAGRQARQTASRECSQTSMLVPRCLSASTRGHTPRKADAQPRGARKRRLVAALGGGCDGGDRLGGWCQPMRCVSHGSSPSSLVRQGPVPWRCGDPAPVLAPAFYGSDAPLLCDQGLCPWRGGAPVLLPHVWRLRSTAAMLLCSLRRASARGAVARLCCCYMCGACVVRQRRSTGPVPVALWRACAASKCGACVVRQRAPLLCRQGQWRCGAPVLRASVAPALYVSARRRRRGVARCVASAATVAPRRRES